MKIFKFLAFLLVMTLITQSFLTACPTCWGKIQLEKNSSSIGEMEVSPSSSQDNHNEDDYEDDETDGFTEYDRNLQEEINHE
jgi:hypothetical protein